MSRDPQLCKFCRRRQVYTNTIRVDEVSTWEAGGPTSTYARCMSCHEYATLGPANDDGDQVAVEIRAAELSNPVDERPLPAAASVVGYQGFCAYRGDKNEPDYSGNLGERIMCFGWRAGWLTAAIIHYDDEVQS